MAETAFVSFILLPHDSLPLNLAYKDWLNRFHLMSFFGWVKPRLNIHGEGYFSIWSSPGMTGACARFPLEPGRSASGMFPRIFRPRACKRAGGGYC